MVIVKYLPALLLIITFISPIIYGLIAYNWDLQEFTSFVYNPPKVTFNIKVIKCLFFKDHLIIKVNVSNNGDLNITFISLNASVYNINNRHLSKASLLATIKVKSGETRELDIIIPVTEKVRREIIMCYLQMKPLRFKIIGTIIAKVYLSKIEAPINIKIKVPYEALIP